MTARWPTAADLLTATADRRGDRRPSASPADIQRAATLEASIYARVEPGPAPRLADPPPLQSRIDPAISQRSRRGRGQAEPELGRGMGRPNAKRSST